MTQPRPLPLTFTAEVVEATTGGPYDEPYRPVAALFCNGEEVWRDPTNQWIDVYGDGFTFPDGDSWEAEN